MLQQDGVLVRRTILWLSALASLVWPAGVRAWADDLVALRAESLMVLPNSQPVAFVRVRNTGTRPYSGKIVLEVPESWRMSPPAHDVRLAVDEEARLAFSIQGGNESTSNSYPVVIRAISGDREVTRRQQIAVASAPYFKPIIDGDPGDWKDSIPVAFTSSGRRTTICTFWNRRQFSVLVQVEEDRHIRFEEAEQFDAVQLVIAARGSRSGTTPAEEASRFEYLLVAGRDGSGKCFQLAESATRLSVAAETRRLDFPPHDQAEVAVRRDGGMTYYECSLPLAPMQSMIRPGEGREFYLGLLVHDPDGTGIRDWGEAAGLWESQRNVLAWSRWVGAKWNDTPPMDCRTEWGMCSSRY